MPASLHDMGDASTPLPELIILDTSVLLELSNRSHPEALSFLGRLTQQALRGNALILVPLLVMEECYFKLIQGQYEKAGYKQWYHEGYKAHPEQIAVFGPLLSVFEQGVLSLPAVITGPDDLIVSSDSAMLPLHQKMLENIRDFQVLPKDAYIVAEAQRLGVTDMATLDKDWDRFDGFTVYRPL